MYKKICIKIIFVFLSSFFATGGLPKAQNQYGTPPFPHYYLFTPASCDLVCAFNLSTLAILRIMSFTIISSWEFSL